MKHYHQKASPYKGILRMACNYCAFETHLPFRMDMHLQTFHPDKLQQAEEVIESLSDLPKSELVELAKEKGVAIRGSKDDIIERLQEAE
jgi:hypothetical protein